jgi:hypothetical protein
MNNSIPARNARKRNRRPVFLVLIPEAWGFAAEKVMHVKLLIKVLFV